MKRLTSARARAAGIVIPLFLCFGCGLLPLQHNVCDMTPEGSV